MIIFGTLGLPWWHSGEESASKVGDLGSVPGSGRSPGIGNGNPFQHSRLGRATVHELPKSRTRLSTAQIHEVTACCVLIHGDRTFKKFV